VHLGGIVGDSKSDDVILDEDTVLSGYIDGALSPTEQRHVAARLASDPAFAARLATLQRNDGLLRMAYDQAVHDPLPAQVLRRLSGASVAHPPVRHERGLAHDSIRAYRCWLLTKRVAKPLVQLYRKHSR
jgi:anti-sigma factor RsiW